MAVVVKMQDTPGEHQIGWQPIWSHIVDGQNPAPPKNPWNEDSPVNTNEQWFPMLSLVMQDFVHPQIWLWLSKRREPLMNVKIAGKWMFIHIWSHRLCRMAI